MKKLFVTFAITLCCISNFSIAKVNELVLHNINIIDVKTLALKPNMTIVISDAKISSIEKGDYKSTAENAIYIDMTGKYAIPGLIDAHVHHATNPDTWDKFSTTKARLQHLLRGGVTSVRDMGGDGRTLANLKRLAEIDQIQSPDIYFSVIIGGQTFFDDPRTIASAKGRQSGNTVWMRSVDNESNFDAIVLQAKGLGATGIKVYADLPADVLPPLYTSAKEHGLKVWAHTLISPATPLESVQAGVEVMSHIPDLAGQVIANFRDWRIGKKQLSDDLFERSMDAGSYDELFDAIKKNDVILDATMSVFERSKSANDVRKKNYQQAKFLLRLAAQEGLKIGAGTDAFADLENDALPPLFKELSLLVNEGGLTPLQAIQSATLINAQALGIEQTHGYLAAGKRANLVILDEDPSADIENTKKIRHVIKNGQFVFRGDMPGLPFVNAKQVDGTLWMSGQIGNLPTTMTLAGDTIESQMHQTLKNIGSVLKDYDLDYNDVVKCTLMLADIDEWAKANVVYKQYFTDNLPTRSAFGANGLALNAKVEVECIAQL
ncbi:amidohydrolase family protein [Glaciecola petra]|uniref:Rid family hydrolase n=1 Tax=Glaciecola petra TaxID=3075602 RepID=A0ABU2ZV16_9ALTE|nr:amidohydrolase family protein [Aestuariibacter sp. P117]MDT0595267.1 Rid family hydrolase [Aestuariibacter sp. P117]